MQKKIQAYIFKKTMRGYEFLLLKRTPKYKSIWQPVTGKVEKGEKVLDAAKREIKEETSLTDFIKIIDLEYSFKFKKEGKEIEEYCFGFEVSPSVEKINLSDEHQNYSWVNFETAMELIFWESNKKVLELLYKKLLPEK